MDRFDRRMSGLVCAAALPLGTAGCASTPEPAAAEAYVGRARVSRWIHRLAQASVLALLIGSGAAGAEADLAKLAWLAGCWQSETAEAGSGELWTAPAGGTMFGISRTIRQGRTVEFEFMELRSLPDGRLAYIAHPSGQRTTTFPLLRISDTEAVFENPQHDFPQRVAYARVGETQLRARIEGRRSGGALRVVEFPLRRVDCAASVGAR